MCYELHINMTCTTVVLSREVRDKIEKHKLYKRDTVNDIIERIINFYQKNHV